MDTSMAILDYDMVKAGIEIGWILLGRNLLAGRIPNKCISRSPTGHFDGDAAIL